MIGSPELTIRLCRKHEEQLRRFVKESDDYNGHPNVLHLFRKEGGLNVIPFFEKKGNMTYSGITCSICLPAWIALDEIREHIQSHTYDINAPYGFSKWLLPNQRK